VNVDGVSAGNLLAKPFVILAGVSGTGKSKLAELVAEFYSTTMSPGSAAGGAPGPGEAFVFVPSKRTTPSRTLRARCREAGLDRQPIDPWFRESDH
jgi:hypothetical protein